MFNRIEDPVDAKMSKMMSKESYYESGEEKFGILSTSLYNLFNLNPVIRKFYGFVHEDLSKYGPRTLLDIGSGTGTVLLRYASDHNPEVALGIDPSPFMVKYASKRAFKLGLSGKVSFVQGSSRYIPGNDKFEIITTSLSFHHWNNRLNSIPYLLSRTDGDGMFVVYEITGRKGFSRRIAKAHLMQRNEFETISSELGINVDISEKNGFIRAAFRMKP